jgi:hypothetical protein
MLRDFEKIVRAGLLLGLCHEEFGHPGREIAGALCGLLIDQRRFEKLLEWCQGDSVEEAFFTECYVMVPKGVNPQLPVYARWYCLSVSWAGSDLKSLRDAFGKGTEVWGMTVEIHQEEIERISWILSNVAAPLLSRSLKLLCEMATKSGGLEI